MALDACVKNIVCALGANVISALNAILDAQKVVLTAQLDAIAAQLVIINIATVPVQIAKDAAQEVADAALSVTNLVPMQTMEGCEDIGQVLDDIRDTVEADLATVNNLLNDLNRKLSFKAELEAAQEFIQEKIDRINEFQLELEACDE
jgi:hypothetical protein